jgi:ribosomal protein S18 acetylase RimI-like enzyme
MSVTIRTMTPGDYHDVAALWGDTDGVGITGADSQSGVTGFLARNEELSFVAEDEGRVVAAVLCGHDGRRGYISHLVVADPHRRRGVASELVDRCIAGLRRAGIEKCHLFVFRGNENAVSFWRETGWTEREDIATFSKFTELDLSDRDGSGQDTPEE